MFYLFALKTSRQVAYTHLRQSEAVDAYLFTHRRRKLDMTLRGEVWRQSTFPVSEEIFDMRVRRYGNDADRLIRDKSMALAYHGTLVKESSSNHLLNLPRSQHVDYIASLLPGEIARTFSIVLTDVPWRDVDDPSDNEFYPRRRRRAV